MSDLQLYIRAGAVGRPPDGRIKPAVLDAMRRIQTNAAPEAVSREVVVSLRRKVHWTTARKYLDELTKERLVVRRTVRRGKKTFFFYDLVMN